MAVRKRKSQYGSKTAFVLSIPFDTPAVEVIAQAKLANLTITRPYVHKVRTMSKDPSNHMGDRSRRFARHGGPREGHRRDATAGGRRGAEAADGALADLQVDGAQPRRGRKSEKVGPRTESGTLRGLEEQFAKQALDLGLARSSELLALLRSHLRA